MTVTDGFSFQGANATAITQAELISLLAGKLAIELWGLVCRIAIQTQQAARWAIAILITIGIRSSLQPSTTPCGAAQLKSAPSSVLEALSTVIMYRNNIT